MVTFEDEPTRLGLRATHGAKHSAYVRSVAGKILCSGSLRDTSEGRQTGAMWVIDANTREEAEAIFQGDPFFKEGLRANVRIWHWTKGVWDGRLPG
jgi:uncharacterized protein YciI